MHRRDFIKSLAMAGTSFPLLANSSQSYAQSGYNGQLLMLLQLEGGVDITSFCDPKANQNGELEINRWSRSGEIQTAGNIQYAPVAGNAAFFEKYYQDMLVINGVDAQTNSHTVGVLHNWSGRSSDGFPSLSAIMAASMAPDLPMSYVNFGGFGATQSIIRSSKVDDVRLLQNIVFPNVNGYDDSQSYRRQSDIDRIDALHQKSIQRLMSEAQAPAGNLNNRRFYSEATQRAEGLKAFGALIPTGSELQRQRELPGDFFSTLHQQVQISLLAFKAGISVSADLLESGFDTHNDNDEQQSTLLSNVTDAIDYLWTTADQLGIADRITLVVGSDFGRTPHYNAGDGKDHWPIGSYLVMERNASFTNRVFGETDGGHNSYPVNLATGQQDYVNGAPIYPKDVHLALRRHLGIDSNEFSNQFRFTGTNDFNIFG